MIYGFIEYINRYGKISVKAFSNDETMIDFIEKLQQKKVKYIVTYCD